ncbi:MAG: amidohydrolase family protein [Anaerovoracaceae bacterium]|nr:amidohydrolase family protein [Anaerovoracaceae bacterium]
MKMLDILITGGKYPDFTENCFKYANIGVKDGKIAYIGGEEPEAAETIDAGGRVVSPGFIDIHMHEEKVSEGDKWVIAKMMARQGVTLAVGGNCGVMNQPVKDFKAMIERMGGCPVNYIILTGYNYYRHDVLGLGHYDRADKKVWDRIREFMLEDLKEGAYGISFGIEYDPGITTEEIKYAIGVSDDDHLLVSAHYRADGAKAAEAVREMIDIQESTGKKFQVSHLSSCSAMGQMKEVLDLINEEHEKNPKFNYDTYPYNAFSTHIGSTVFEDGCLEAWGKDYSDIMLTVEPYKNVRCTKEIFEDARKNYPDMLAVAFVMNEEEIAEAIANPIGMVASDGIINNGLGHPRAAGTFPRVLGKYVREEGKTDLLTALRKMTYEPAARLELENRKGLIAEGADADITIFDPDTIADGPQFGDIDIPNKGIDYVIVNGRIAVCDNNIVSEKAGKFISYNNR